MSQRCAILLGSHTARGTTIALHVARSHDPVALVDHMAGVMAEPPADPFAPEVVAVHSRGIERWLTQQLADRLGTDRGGDGIAANLRFPFPGRLADDVLARASGIDPHADPWREERLVWTLMEVLADPDVDGSGDGPAWHAPLAHHLTPDAAADGRVAALARRVARLYDRYAVHRPEMLLRWLDGSDLDADRRRLEHRAWQAALYRDVAAHLQTPPPPARLGAALQRVRAEGDAELPDRLFLHGLTALPVTHLRVLAALAERHDVHALLLHPAPSLWSPRAGGRRRPRGRDGVPAADHPLLASWGRDALELDDVLASVAQPATDLTLSGGAFAPPDTLLGRVQRELHDDVATRSGAQLPLRPPVDRQDTSVQVHGAHGPRRQVEALRDLLLHAFAADPTLAPRDVLVLCPDIERFAPLLHAVLVPNPTVDDALPDLRLRLADRALRRTNPLVEVLDDLLELTVRAVTGSDLLRLLRRAPVMARFGLADADVDRVEGWLAETGVTWGLDAADRAAHGLPGVEVRTIAWALRRLHLGVAVREAPGRALGSVAPVSAVGGSDLGLLGRVSEAVERLGDVRTSFATRTPVVAWADRLAQAARMLTSGDDQPWAERELVALLDDVAAEGIGPDGRPSRVPLGVNDVRVLLADRLDGRPSTVDHRTGDLTACTLVPMRSVPHRLVVLLGMDDDAFPRRVVPDGDDLVSTTPRVGDRDPRSEDRQLLLDAVLSARERLVVLHTSHDERTGVPRPPAAPVVELLDELARVPRDGDPEQGVPHHVQHPRDGGADELFTVEPPGPRDHSPVARGRPADLHRPFSWDRHARTVAPTVEHVEVPELPERRETWDLAVLGGLLGDPLWGHASSHLGMLRRRDAHWRSDHMPTKVTGLDTWAVRDRLVTAIVGGVDPADAVDHLHLTGVLPPGQPGVDAAAEHVAVGRAMVALLGDDLEGTTTVRVVATLPDGRRIVGSVSGANPVAGRVTRLVGHTDKAKHLVRDWLRLLLLAADRPEVGWTLRSVHPDRAGLRDRVLRVPAVEPAARRAWAHGHLTRLADLADLVRVEPPPLTSELLDRAGFPDPGSSGWTKGGLSADDVELLALVHGTADRMVLAARPVTEREVERLGWDPGRPRAEAWLHGLAEGIDAACAVREHDVMDVLAGAAS